MIQSHIFENGFRMIHETPQSKNPITSIYLFCDVGSAFEQEGNRGAAHFIEHMCFKGTKKIPNSKQIVQTYDNVGADFNAGTDKRHTYYNVKCGDVNVHHSLDVLADMVLNSTFKKSEYNKEHQVVIEENIKSEDDGNDMIENMMATLLYKNSSFEHPVDTLLYHSKGKLNYDEVVSMYHRYYQPHNMILSIVSNIPFENLKKHMKTTYLVKKPNVLTYREYLFAGSPINSLKPIYHIQSKVGQTTLHLQIGFRTCSYYSDDKYPLEVLRKIVGGYFSSRLFMTLREKNGLTYSSRAKSNQYDFAGGFVLYAQTDSNKIIKQHNGKPGVLPIMIKIIRDLYVNGITQEELNMAKQNLRGSFALDVENTANNAYSNGVQLLMKIPPKKIVSTQDLYHTYYESITKEHVNRVINQYLNPATMIVCMLGEKVPSQESVQKVCE
jgi:predicted Zn-dependent peptidase